MNVEQLLQKSGTGERDITRRVAVCDLLPEHEECDIVIHWRLVSPSRIRAIAKQGEREYKLAKKSGKLSARPGEPEREEADFVGELLAVECVERVVGLTPEKVRSYGLLALTPDQVAAWNATLGEGSLDDVEGFLDLLSRESRPYRQRLFELQHTASVVEAEDSLRKKASLATSATQGSEGA